MASSLSIARLVEIEKTADEARNLCGELLSAHPMEWANKEALSSIASLLTLAVIKATPNLRNQDGIRVAGVLEKDAAGARLEYEEYEPFYRQMFTIAHELGHYFLHRDQDFCDADIEAEADAFAAAFLIPLANLRHDLKTFGPSALFLSRRYCVSDGTMLRRINQAQQIMDDKTI